MGMRTNNQGRTALSEINVTPFVDVMLVLLIIFMVTAPILYQGVQVDIPKIESKPLPAAERGKKIVVTITEDGEIYIDKQRYSLYQLREEIEKLVESKGKSLGEEDIFLRADEDVSYGAVIQVMATLKNAGVEKLGLITEPPSNKEK